MARSISDVGDNPHQLLWKFLYWRGIADFSFNPKCRRHLRRNSCRVDDRTVSRKYQFPCATVHEHNICRDPLVMASMGVRGNVFEPRMKSSKRSKRLCIVDAIDLRQLCRSCCAGSNVAFAQMISPAILRSRSADDFAAQDAPARCRRLVYGLWAGGVLQAGSSEATVGPRCLTACAVPNSVRVSGITNICVRWPSCCSSSRYCMIVERF